MDAARAWRVYLLASADGRSSYVGIALDPQERLLQHNGERPGGARRTRAGRPWSLVRVSAPLEDRGSAERAERALKQARGLTAREARMAAWESGPAAELAPKIRE